jgi:hypothetical protein
MQSPSDVFCAERIIGAAIVDRVKERIITPRNCETPERRARVVHGLNTVMNHQLVLAFIVNQTKLELHDVDAVIERWIRDAVMRRNEYPIVLRNKFKRFLIERAQLVGKVKR